jgi:hypothetical protein
MVRVRTLQDFANALPHMIMSERMGHADMEALAELPDGLLKIDLLTREARHSDGDPVSLQVVQVLAEWLKKRLGGHDKADADLAGAELELSLRTNAVPTDRTRAILFDWNCSCTLRTREGKARTGQASGRKWYDRDKWTAAK